MSVAIMRGIEEQLAELNLSPEEEVKERKRMYKAMRMTPQGFISKDICLPEGALLIAVYGKEVKQATASEGLIWVDGKGYASLSTAAAAITGNYNQYGWKFWTHTYVFKKGIQPIERLREARKNGKRINAVNEE